MTPESKTLPYRWILPAAQILACLVILWPIRNQIIASLVGTYRIYTRPVISEPEVPNDRLYNYVFNPDDPEVIRKTKIWEFRLQTPAMLNLPVLPMAVPYAMLTPAKTDWVPRGMDFRIWRAITWPIVGLIFWWVAGCAIESIVLALRKNIRPSTHWIQTIIGLFALTCGVLCIVASFFGIDDPDFLTTIFRLAGFMWVVLGGLTVASRIIQWKMRTTITPTESIAGPTS